jgi:hypothetical protein
MMIVASVSITTATRTFLAVARSATKSLSDWVAFLILPISPFSLSLYRSSPTTTYYHKACTQPYTHTDQKRDSLLWIAIPRRLAGSRRWFCPTLGWAKPDPQGTIYWQSSSQLCSGSRSNSASISAYDS